MNGSVGAPRGAGAVYLVLVLTGIVLGFLCGAEQLHPAALFAFGVGGISVFLAWSIWRLDPAYLLQSKRYREETPESESN